MDRHIILCDRIKRLTRIFIPGELCISSLPYNLTLSVSFALLYTGVNPAPVHALTFTILATSLSVSFSCSLSLSRPTDSTHSICHILFCLYQTTMAISDKTIFLALKSTKSSSSLKLENLLWTPKKKHLQQQTYRHGMRLFRGFLLFIGII